MFSNLNKTIISQYNAQYSQIKTSILNFKRNRISSWILYGKQGIGKSLFAKALAQELLNNSSSYLELESHPDFKMISKIDGKDLSIEQIREIKEFAHKTTSISELKVVVIDDIDFMSKYAANALLKILEEPPFNFVLLLISHQIHTVLPTIKSRAAKLKFENLDHNYSARLLNQDYQIDLPTAEQLLKISNNSIGLALQINQEEGLATYKKILDHLPYLDATLLAELDKFNNDLLHFLTLRIVRLVLGFEVSEQYYLDFEIKFSHKMQENHLVNIGQKIELWDEVNNYFMDLKFANLERKHIFYLIFNQFRQFSI